MTFLYETHLHTCQSSACGKSTGAEHVRAYKAAGYTGIFVTDHFFGGNTAIPRDLPWEERIRRFARGYEDAKAEGDRVGLDVFFAWEETFQGDDYLIYGLDPAWLIQHPEADHWSRREQLEKVHAGGGCVVQAHPFRLRDYIPKALLGLRYCDGIEIANAGNEALWDVCAANYAAWAGLPVTAGSDNHLSKPGQMEDGRLYGVRLEKRLTCAADYARVILSGQSPELFVPEGRLKATPDMVCPDSYWLDEKERAVRTDVDWVKMDGDISL
ncbi:MAG: PHP domain-containing protein [Clostridia bacterium]|nr:PHP domain-containing protein [Clostridia bacterium]